MASPPPRHLGALTTQQLTHWLTEAGNSPGSAYQLAKHLVGDFACRKIKQPVSEKRLELAYKHFSNRLPKATPTLDPDGTIRYAIELQDGQVVEAVAIFHPQRTTVCLSTQVGCARACVFCETGRLGLFRNLLAEEMVSQLAVVTRHLLAEGRERPTNVVFMGMGEPMDNLRAVLEATEVMSDTCGFSIGPRRITVSTVGVVPKMREFYQRSRCRLAVSLHSANDGERKALLPVARSWDLATLKQTISESPQSVLLQWTLIAGVNDSERHARELIDFCQGLDVRVNLIPLNPGPEESLRAPSMPEVRAFQKRLADSGLRTLVRMPHGQEVGGACGQLAGSFRGEQRIQGGPRLGKAR